MSGRAFCNQRQGKFQRVCLVLSLHSIPIFPGTGISASCVSGVEQLERWQKRVHCVQVCVSVCNHFSVHQDGPANKQKRFSSWVSEWPQSLVWILERQGTLKVGYLRDQRVHARYWRNHRVWGGHSLAPGQVHSFEPGSAAWLSYVYVWGSWVGV